MKRESCSFNTFRKVFCSPISRKEVIRDIDKATCSPATLFSPFRYSIESFLVSRRFKFSKRVSLMTHAVVLGCSSEGTLTSDEVANTWRCGVGPKYNYKSKIVATKTTPESDLS